jgi:hypothetical protein
VEKTPDPPVVETQNAPVIFEYGNGSFQPFFLQSPGKFNDVLKKVNLKA